MLFSFLSALLIISFKIRRHTNHNENIAKIHIIDDGVIELTKYLLKCCSDKYFFAQPVIIDKLKLNNIEKSIVIINNKLLFNFLLLQKIKIKKTDAEL